tara:strand:+ start:240 stop:446 length:207 start_codon:yes stop_codon:yes gene_type:complete
LKEEKLLLWNEEETEQMRKEKIEEYNEDQDETIFKKSLQRCHDCGTFLTFEELEIFELHCESCKYEKE